MSKSSHELKSLVARLHPRSPHEVMGEAATSSLFGSTITAAVSTVVLVLATTLVVFLVHGPPEKKTGSAKRAGAAVGRPSAETTAPKPATDPSSLTAGTFEETTGSPNAQLTDPESAVEAMGIGETKDADSPTDSLENRLDQILDGLE